MASSTRTELTWANRNQDRLNLGITFVLKMSEARKRLKSKYKELYSTVKAILFKHDPIRINLGGNTDEYDPEVGTILPRLKDANSESDVVTIIHEEFVRSFGVKIVGDRKQPIYRKIASEVWTAWLKFSRPIA